MKLKMSETASDNLNIKKTPAQNAEAFLFIA